ncbi:MAG: murein L,D-transpeptidase [Thermoleophilia bacterium]|nr:murein L,D-transpeptidase [Thermoleophilia bacterium]
MSLSCRSLDRVMRRFLVTVVAVAAVALATGAMGSSEPGLTVTLSLSRPVAPYGAAVVASGAVEPAVAGEEIVLELHGAGTWSQIARVVTDDSGRFQIELRAEAGGTLIARAIAASVASEPVELAVLPKVKIRTRPGLAFGGAKLTARIQPADYSGPVEIRVTRNGEVVASTRATTRRGVLRATVPTPGTGRFGITIWLPATARVSAHSVTARVTARGRVLQAGSAGPDVRGLNRRLAQLRFHVPAPSQTFTWDLVDSVIAFQKAYGLPRTGIVGPETWRKLTAARPLEPRFRRPANHIEVDKTRQILLEVRGGEVAAVLPVSSGATGNTPEGRHAVRWKALATTTWLGPGILYRTMTFYGNSFAIHGWTSVPAYPASHGCVRIPIWTADWLYNRTPVGETVYVYS